jgi:hypothetical protein
LTYALVIVRQEVSAMQHYKMGLYLFLIKFFSRLFKINKYLNSQNCYCGNTYGKDGAASLWGLKCNKPCSGNQSQICGGEYANSIYQVECLKQTLGLFRGEHFLF